MIPVNISENKFAMLYMDYNAALERSSLYFAVSFLQANI